MQSFLKNIVEFIDVLRTAGMRVSNSESIDAINALNHVDLLIKEEVRIALSVCLAKSEEEKKIFSEAFDRFFIPADQRAEYIHSVIEGMEQKRLEVNEKALELKFRDENIVLDDQLKEVYAALSENEKQSIREFLDKTTSGKNVKDDFKPVAESIIQSKLKSLKNKYNGSRSTRTDTHGNTASEAGIIAGDVIATIHKENELLHKKLGEINDNDIPQVIRLIEAMTERLLKNIARKRKISGKSARLDFSRTISCSLSTGGVPFMLKYRHKSIHKYKYLILCDVSASMHRFSGFVLQFISGIHSTLLNSDCYIFSQDIEHISINRFGSALKFEQQVVNSPIWRKGTDISKALDLIMKESGTVLNSSVIVLIVSDAKTVNVDKTVEYLKKMASSVKKILWLNPIPEGEWPDIQSIEKYHEVCCMLDCSTLDKLHQTVSRI